MDEKDAFNLAVARCLMPVVHSPIRTVCHSLRIPLSAALIVTGIACATTPRLSPIEKLLAGYKNALDSCLSQSQPTDCGRERRRYKAVVLALRVATTQGEDALITPPYPPAFAEKQQAFRDCLAKFPLPPNKQVQEWAPCKSETVVWRDYSDARRDVWRAFFMNRFRRSSMSRRTTTPLYRSRKNTSVEQGQTVYDADECVGTAIMGRCQGTIVPKKSCHPTCHGAWINGRCTGPMF